MSTTRDRPSFSRRGILCTMKTQSSMPKKKNDGSRRRRIIRPEPGSLYDIMHDHAGDSLFVTPLCWTDQHAKVLGARWEECASITTPVPDLLLHAHLEPSDLAQDVTSKLNLFCSALTPFQEQGYALKGVMSSLFPTSFTSPQVSAELNLYFGDRMFRKAIRVPLLWKSPDGGTCASFNSVSTRPATSFGRIPTSSTWSQSSSSYPMLAYVNRGQLTYMRQHLYRVVRGPDENMNSPVSELQKLRSKLLTPSDADHDSIYLGILLAMAQARFYRSSSRSPPPSQGKPRLSRCGKPVEIPSDLHDVRVQLLTFDDDKQEFLVYSAVVTSTFLDRFARPHKFSRPEDEEIGDGIKIEYTRVPVWPLLGLRERLGKALGRGIADDILDSSPDAISLQDPLIARPRRISYPSLKRRRTASRETLTELLINSFEVEVEEDPSRARDNTPSLSPEKRRRLAESIGPLEVC